MKKYETYKDSGVEWIGAIPKHWTYSKLKYYSSSKTGSTPSRDEESYWDEGTIPWMSSGEINQKIISRVEGKITKKGYEESSVTLLPIDTVMVAMNGQGKTKGTVGILKIETTCNQSLTGFISDKSKLHPMYLFYFLESKYNDLRGLVGEDREGLSSVVLKNVFIDLPSIQEQVIIANYLDHKTSQLDTLISKKEKLIELLQEERTAIINHAVTKGLNPNAPMRDSGIEWLGEIPEHWELKKLKYLVHNVKTGSTPPSDVIEYFEPGEIDWFTPGDFKQLILTDSKRKISLKAIENGGCKVFPKHSVLLIGIGATLGKIGILLEQASSNQQINAIIFNKLVINPFYGAYFLSSFSEIIVSMASAATLAILNQSQTKDIILVSPPLFEQDEICEYIYRHDKRIDDIITKTQQEIKLLKEYKTALISEVVTGKVDVRNEILN